MILAKLTKISPKMQNLGQSGPYNCFCFLFFVFVLLITCFKFVPKSIHQIAQFQFQKYINFLAGGGGAPSDIPLCVEVNIWHLCSPQTKHHQTMSKKTDLGSWLGGTCNFEVGRKDFVDNA